MTLFSFDSKLFVSKIPTCSPCLMSLLISLVVHHISLEIAMRIVSCTSMILIKSGICSIVPIIYGLGLSFSRVISHINRRLLRILVFDVCLFHSSIAIASRIRDNICAYHICGYSSLVNDPLLFPSLARECRVSKFGRTHIVVAFRYALSLHLI